LPFANADARLDCHLAGAKASVIKFRVEATERRLLMEAFLAWQGALALFLLMLAMAGATGFLWRLGL
jgi:hypothetical protein